MRPQRIMIRCPRCQRNLARECFAPRFRDGRPDGVAESCRDCVEAWRVFKATRTQRFWSHVDRSGGDDACWPWTGYCTPSGYGRFGRVPGHNAAHRLAWELTYGPIPDGMRVCHRCDKPPCCNFTHMFLGTDAENHADRAAKGRVVRLHGDANPMARLTAEAATEVRRRYAGGGISQRALAAIYGVHPNTIARLVRGESWKHG